MTQVVQASCPHCRNTLRIPAEWLDQPMRCKFCQNIFEARQRPGGAALPATAISAAPITAKLAPAAKAPLATGVTAHPPTPNGLVFAPDHDTSTRQAPGRRRSGGAGKVLVFVGCAVMMVVVIPAGIAAALVFGGLALWTAEIGEHPGDLVENPKDRPIVAVRDKGGAKEKKGGARDAVVVLGKDKGGKPPKVNTGPMPRRALLINVCNYLYLNRIDPGRPGTTSVGGLRDNGMANAPMLIPTSQDFTLCDAGTNPHPTELSVIKNAIQDFCDTSREQDRIVILFAGHATEVEKECYLIPIGGRKDRPETMIPLAWVYSKLAASRARQKALILDAFRFAPARGFELPGAGASDEGEMGEEFDLALQKPPPGVQVWSSCIKGQRSIEFEGGSAFLQAVSRLRDGGKAMGGISAPTDPLPIDADFVKRVNDKMKELIGDKFVQTSRLSGTAPADGPAPNPAEPPATLVALKMPVAPGGDVASRAEIGSILADIKRLPVVRKGRAEDENSLLKAENLPPFPAKQLATYKPDDNRTLLQLMEELKDPKGAARQDYAKKHPLRVAVVDAINALAKTENLVMRETITGPINDKQKAAFKNEQSTPGVLLFELEQVIKNVEKLADDKEVKDAETSKRWRAHFDFTWARLRARYVYIYEYNFLIAQIRTDSLPPLDGGDGWRVASRKKIMATDGTPKKYAKDVEKAWKKIQETYPDTPWEVIAYRESLVALGLEWKTKKE